MQRGNYWGFILDGSDAGNVLESDHSWVVISRVQSPVVDFFEETSAVDSSLAFSETRLFHQRMTIGDRQYGVWCLHPLAAEEDFTKAVLLLIDMDPGQARLCEFGQRRGI